MQLIICFLSAELIPIHPQFPTEGSTHGRHLIISISLNSINDITNLMISKVS